MISATPTAAAEELSGREHQAVQQLALYARDLRGVVRRERMKSKELAEALSAVSNLAENLQRSVESERERRAEVERAHSETLLRLVKASQFKDQETGSHIVRVSQYSEVVARALGLTGPYAALIAEAAPMHDVGKIGVLDSILRKSGPLTSNEWVLMQAHTTIGAEMLNGSNSHLLKLAAEIAISHHERWDGSGYPRGLRGEEIPLSGRIVMLADQYDALRSSRPYKEGFSHEHTSRILLEGDGRTLPIHFEPRMLEAFRDVASEFEKIFQVTTEHSPAA